MMKIKKEIIGNHTLPVGKVVVIKAKLRADKSEQQKVVENNDDQKPKIETPKEIMHNNSNEVRL